MGKMILKPSMNKIENDIQALSDRELIELMNTSITDWDEAVKEKSFIHAEIRSQLEQLCMAQYLYVISDSVQSGQMPSQFMEMDEHIIPS